MKTDLSLKTIEKLMWECMDPVLNTRLKEGL